MPDREKVINDLQDAVNDDWMWQHADYYAMAMENAISLLKEQDAEWIEYPECLAYDGAYSDSHIVCSACKHVFSIMDNCTEEFDYCPHCGAKMKQEGKRKD